MLAVLSAVKTELKFFEAIISISSNMREKGFQQNQTVNDFKISSIRKGYNLYNHQKTFISPNYTFPWLET